MKRRTLVGGAIAGVGLTGAYAKPAKPKAGDIPMKEFGPTVDGKTLLDHMRPKIASWWMPDAVEFLDEFPMTGTGKVLKSALREKFREYRLA